MHTNTLVDSLLAAKANAGDTHGISLYTGTAGDPAQEHLLQGTAASEPQQPVDPAMLMNYDRDGCQCKIRGAEELGYQIKTSR